RLYRRLYRYVRRHSISTLFPYTTLFRSLFLLVLILLLMPTLNFLPVWFALSLLRFRLPSRLPMMVILWMVGRVVGTEEDSKRTKIGRAVQQECRARCRMPPPARKRTARR